MGVMSVISVNAWDYICGTVWQIDVGVRYKNLPTSGPNGPLGLLTLKAPHFGLLVNTQLVLYCSARLQFQAPNSEDH